MKKPNFLQGQYDYELEAIFRASTKIKRQFTKLLQRESKRLHQRAAESANYNTQDHLRSYVAFLDRVSRLVNVKPE